MQLTTFISAATALVATASARTAVELNKECDTGKPHARIINRCDYPVHLWSVLKGDGCPGHGMVTLEKGEIYSENYHRATDSTGVSIKISKTTQCKGNDIVQLEYYLNQKGKQEYWGNYFDVSYVDCLAENCATRQEGYYLVVGNQTGATSASAANTWCPILSCHDAVSCAKCSYILPDDVQTKTCDLESSMDFYMCGGHAPTEDYGSDPNGDHDSPPATQPKPLPPSTTVSPDDDDDENVKAPAITPPPAVNKENTDNEHDRHGKGDKDHDDNRPVKTEVVYVTAYEYVHAKRHAHGHARRHQRFHA